MTSHEAEILSKRLAEFRELQQQLDELDGQIKYLTEQNLRNAGYPVCHIAFVRFNTASPADIKCETILGAKKGGAAVLDREIVSFLLDKLNVARARVIDMITKIPGEIKHL